MPVENVLLDIFVLLIAAKLGAEVADRIGVPAVVAEIVAGVLIGPSVLGLVGDVGVLRVLGELGVVLLLLEVGLQMDLSELVSVGRASAAVALIGVAVPGVAGYLVLYSLGHDTTTSLFMGAALTATSVGITARVFSDLRALATVEARTVLGAAVADDVLGLVILTVVARVATAGAVAPLDVVGVIAAAVAFLIVAGGLGMRLVPPMFALVHRFARAAGTTVALALAAALGFAVLADAAGLAPIVGAFVAGLSLARSTQSERIRRDLTPVGHLFVPVFFLQIGIDSRIDAFVRPEVLGVAGVLLTVAVAGKLAAALGMIGSTGDKALVGLGMLPRGEVGLIFAGLGLRSGVFDQDLYAALLLVVLATTLMAPPLLRVRLGRLAHAPRRRPEAAVKMPAEGWVQVADGVVDLTGEPPAPLALPLGLHAARLAADARPGPRILEWLGSLGGSPLRWDDRARAALFELLASGNARSWRFLEVSAILDRALPELAAAVKRRRDDPFELDPASVMRWSLVEALQAQRGGTAVAAREHALLAHPEWLLLGGLILESAGEDVSTVEPARRLVRRLDLGAAAEQQIAMLVENCELLRGAATRPEAIGEDAIVQIATHLEKPEWARALYLLTLALGGLEPWQRQRLDDLYDLTQKALAQPEVGRRETRNLVERRRADAVRAAGDDAAAVERIRFAPRPYLLSQEPRDIARQAALLEPLPRRDQARVGVTPIELGETWRIDLAARDQHGLLARTTGIVTDAGLDIVDAVVATWGDGGALESFLVRGSSPPDAAALQAALLRSLKQPLQAPSVADAEVTFDDAASPWYTLCDVSAGDRPGLLHALATAFAASGAEVHSARVATVEGIASDRFELTDRNGRKLDAETPARIRSQIETGTEPARRPRPKRR